MARLFDDISIEYLSIDTGIMTAAPFTLATWFYSDDATIDGVIISFAASLETNHYYALFAAGTVAGDPIRFDARGGVGTYAQPVTTSGFTVNTWHHACAIEATSQDHRVYIDGGSVGTDNINNEVPLNIDRSAIGRLADVSPSNYFSGRVADVALWGVVLSTAEIAALAKGASPLTIRSESLVFYMPLVRDNDFDIVGGLSMTAVNTPSVAEHPPQLMGRLSGRIPIATGGGPPIVTARRRSKCGLLQGRIVLS